MLTERILFFLWFFSILNFCDFYVDNHWIMVLPTGNKLLSLLLLARHLYNMLILRMTKVRKATVTYKTWKLLSSFDICQLCKLTSRKIFDSKCGRSGILKKTWLFHRHDIVKSYNILNYESSAVQVLDPKQQKVWNVLAWKYGHTKPWYLNHRR